MPSFAALLAAGFLEQTRVLRLATALAATFLLVAPFPALAEDGIASGQPAASNPAASDDSSLDGRAEPNAKGTGNPAGEPLSSEDASQQRESTPGSSPESLQKILLDWIREEFGARGVVAVLVIIGLVGIFLQWPTIRERLEVIPAVRSLLKPSVPVADPDFYSVALAEFANDSGTNQLRDRVVHALQMAQGGGRASRS